MSDNLFGRCKERLKIWIGAVGANGDGEDIKNAAVVAQKRVEYALQFGSLLQNQDSTSYQKLVSANEYLGKIIGYLEKGEAVYKDLQAIQQIYEAVKVLSDDQIMFKDSAAAANAFNNLFVGLGTLAKHFPPPFDSTIGELLIQCGTLKFFSNFQEDKFGPKSRMGRATYMLTHSEL
jgi:hypothetical protein